MRYRRRPLTATGRLGFSVDTFSDCRRRRYCSLCSSDAFLQAWVIICHVRIHTTLLLHTLRCVPLFLCEYQSSAYFTRPSCTTSRLKSRPGYQRKEAPIMALYRVIVETKQDSINLILLFCWSSYFTRSICNVFEQPTAYAECYLISVRVPIVHGSHAIFVTSTVRDYMCWIHRSQPLEFYDKSPPLVVSCFNNIIDRW
jgi:hypothetical protein